MKKTLTLSLCALLAAGPAAACSTFLIPQSREKIMGKNYDWSHNDGIVVVNKKNLKKTAFGRMANPARWVSRFGSVTFNQHGREFPLGGINEAGLAVEIMWLDETSYPPVGSLPAVNELQWIQYQLDNYSSIQELAASADKLAIAKVFANVHYLACDKTGECAVVEFLNGKLETRSGRDMFVDASTNDSYDASVAFIKNFKGFGGDREIPSDSSSLSRFVRASYLAKNYSPDDSVPAQDYAFGILESVRQPGQAELENITQWNIVYSLAAQRIAFRLQGNPNIQTIAAGNFDYACSSPTMLLEMFLDLSGDVTKSFSPYTRALNRKIVERGLKDIGNLPPEVIESIAAYPESAVCLEKPPLEFHVSKGKYEARTQYNFR